MWRGLRTLPLVVQEEKDGQSEEWIGLNESQDVVDDRNAELDHMRRARGRRHDIGLLMFVCRAADRLQVPRLRLVGRC